MKFYWKKIVACVLVSIMVLNSFTSYAGELALNAEENVAVTATGSDAEDAIIEEVTVDDQSNADVSIGEEIIVEDETKDDEIIDDEKITDDTSKDDETESDIIDDGEGLMEDSEITEEEQLPEDATDSDAEFEHVVDDEHINNGLIDVEYEPDDVLPGENTKKETYETSYISPYASSVKNQRSYGTCWSFSSNGAAEASMKQQGLADKPNYSEWALAYFMFHNPSTWPNAVQELTKDDLSYLPGSYESQWYDNGGNQLWVAMLFSGWRTVSNEAKAVYPYLTGDGSGEVSSNKSSPYVPGDDACNDVAAKLVNARFLPYGSSTNRNLIKQYIKQYGSITLSYYQHSLSRKTDADGEQYWLVDNSSSTSNHSVLCVGWDDDKSAWLIKGSYGSTYSYSKDGYYWLSYDNASIDDWTAMQFTSPDTYEYNYHYDGGSIFTTQSLSDNSKISNIYQVLESDQQIEAVNVGIQTSGTKFDVEIYTSETKMSKPQDGTRANVTATGVTDASGLYTVKLSSPVKVKEGSYFSVVITLDFPGTSSGEVFVDKTYNYSNHVYQNTTAAGESFDLKSSSINWYDAKQYTKPLTYRIKAFTNSVHEGTQHTVTFDANEGTVGQTSKTVYKNSNYGTLPVPTRDGYEFEGWFTADGTQVISSTIYSLDTNQTLYAHWKEKEYTITLDANGGSVYPTSIKMKKGQIYSELPENPTRNGYKFAGWFTDITSGKEIKNGDTFNEFKSITLYAHWKKGYTINFDANGGFVAQSSKTVYQDETYGELPVPTRSGYSFSGWYTGKTIGNLVKSDTKVTGNTTVYAHWTQIKYTITWNDYDGSKLKTTTVPEGSLPSFGGTPSRKSTNEHIYTFIGWDPEVVPASSDATYKAKYSESDRKYTITFLDDNGDVLKRQELKYGDPITKPANPTKAPDAQYMYTFKAWDKPIAETVTGDATYTATYTETVRTYTVQWVNWNDDVLRTDNNVPFGTKPSFGGSPSRPDAEGYSYEFAGWTPAIKTVSENVTYKATYRASILKYTVTIEINNSLYGTVSQNAVEDVEYNTPVSAAKGKLTIGDVIVTAKSKDGYIFNGWSNVPTEITGEITITANFGKPGGGGGGGGSNKKPTQAAGTFSQYWKQDAAGTWRIFNKQNQMITSAWLCDNAITANGLNVWYLIQADGTMLAAGFVQDNTGNFYSLETNHNGYFGMLRYVDGWYNCNGQQVYLQFSHAHDGTFGAVINPDGRAKLQAIYGLTRFYIGNERGMYSASF